MNKNYWNTIKSLARELRKNQTPSENLLWRNLRNRNLSGVKFFRQHPITYQQYGKDYFFIADFYSAEKKVVIEIDGKIHDFQKNYDQQRDLIIFAKGLKVLRFKNGEVEQDIESVLKKIKNSFNAPPSPSKIREGCLTKEGGVSFQLYVPQHPHILQF
ncbi:endonuclease domain-containing protein [Ekhidna sp.]|uniref:endonuclease domain-containing protein n=1 Tax=Ekhidna sp. TaxID=2608089 RepID=UPI003CCC0BD6